MKTISTTLKLSVALAPLAWTSCTPYLGSYDGCAADRDPGPVTIALEPEAANDAAPRVLRIQVHARGPDVVLDPEAFVLLEGEVSESQLGQLARGQPSGALQERIVPSLRWSAQDGAVIVAPTVALEAGAGYTLASGTPRTAISLTVAEAQNEELAELTWPPDGRGVGRRTAVWCGPSALPPWAEATRLAPAGDAGELARGAIGTFGQHCLRFEPKETTAPDAFQLAPPALDVTGGRLALEPTGLRADRPPQTLEPLACEPAETPIGPGCGQVADDRMRLRTPDVALLWAFVLPSNERVVASAPSEPLLIAPLPPNTQWPLPLAFTTLDGTSTLATTTIATAAPMPHLVINEVMANPVGVEPDQEWVELYNDGSVAAALGDYRLIDIGGEVQLPALALAAGAYALIVNESFDAASSYDPAPAADTLLVRVPALGKNGLNNQGEPLELVRGSDVISRFPAEPKPKSGHSVARTSPSALDELASSFARSETPTPGAANAFGEPAAP